jgi:hypothetical protein
MKHVHTFSRQVRKIYTQIDTVLLGAVAAVVGLAALAVAGPGIAGADAGNGFNTLKGQSGYTTLDACGYFSGVQTASNGNTVTNPDGSVTTEEHGTWYGVYNDATNHVVVTPVNSLGTVNGAYQESQTTNTAGDTTGTESFTSNAGKVSQQFSYGPDVNGGFSVNVTATRDLSFLTSNTAGQCYMGTFPRP